MSKYELIRWNCGKYGVHIKDTYLFLGRDSWVYDEPDCIQVYCKMRHWQAKRLLKKLDKVFDTRYEVIP